MYFAASTYSPGPHVERVLAPNLAWLGMENRRTLAEAAPRGQSASRPDPTPVPATPEPRPMEEFAISSETQPKKDSKGNILNVDPLLLTLFLSTRELSAPPEATAEYLLPEPGITLRDCVLKHWSSGSPPLTLREFYNLALRITAHAGTALLLCHNVAKAFARGGAAVYWEVVNRTRGEYSDGTATYTAAVLHRDSVLKTGPFATPSIFYVLFSAAEFGSGDTGDFYRCFAAAVMAYYAAEAQTRIPAVPPSPEAEKAITRLVDAARRLRDPVREDSHAYLGWLWAVSRIFCEASTYARNASAAQSLVRTTVRGVSFGIAQAHQTIDATDPSVNLVGGGSMHLSRATIGRILETSSPHIRRDSTGLSFILLCTVEEGLAVRFASSGWPNQTFAPLATQIVDELGWKAIEHSAHRQVVVRCSMPSADGAQACCECDRGDGFQPWI